MGLFAPNKYTPYIGVSAHPRPASLIACSPLDSSVMSSSQPHPESSDPRVANRARFELELEFVQSLANPFYLHSLAQQGILNQPAFINFLKYLQYWKEKEYAQFLQSALRPCCSVSFRSMMLKFATRYPHALHHLELLQYPQFRSEIGKDEWREYLNQKQFDHWRTWHVSLSSIFAYFV